MTMTMTNIGLLWIFTFIALLTIGDLIYYLVIWRNALIAEAEKTQALGITDPNLALETAKAKKKFMNASRPIFFVIALYLMLFDIGLFSNINYKIGLCLILLAVYTGWGIYDIVMYKRYKRKKEIERDLIPK
ncbi:hypothetical protein PaeCFBP13512_22180 [Paenibacillus sp. CFBP13512]|uniref:hypothetical protein n=1 Tax=Paenibacillus sp. CFBP13512 TaxID=2184007 RepID=UPI0010C0A53D|nr:hypothetical protein [Paenibacillus sp. CFBP13512]TKJ83831.1 hypothetical protein PaeCFBP13512_22180 [Paenibacillus sp. CFBP13512]